MIQQALRSDLPTLVQLLEYLFSIEKDFTFDGTRQLQALNMLLDRQDAVILTAKVQDKIVGMATGQLVISTAEGGLSLWVEDVIVTPSYQNRSIGTNLLQELLLWARSQGASRIQLLADINNRPALEFYKTKGYQKTQLVCFRKFSEEIAPA